MLRAAIMACLHCQIPIWFQMIDNALFNSSFVIRHSSFVSTAFHAFHAQHLITLGVIGLLCVLAAKVARAGSFSQRKWLGRLIGLLLLSYAAGFYIQQGMDHALTWQYSLPLELCNLVLAACIISLFRPNQFTTEIAYFWGTGGVLQATLTPDLAQGFPSLDFTFFFWSHGATLAAIVFLAAMRDFKPRKGSIARMMIALNAYGLVVGLMDAIMGWNYGYLCQKPLEPSLLDFLGPWPWYLLSLELIAFLIFLVLSLPWRVGASIRKQASH
jgi:hypothetical integral membrane protein (TIGR02206 family)